MLFMLDASLFVLRLLDFQERVVLDLFVVYKLCYYCSSEYLKNHFKMVECLNIITHLDIMEKSIIPNCLLYSIPQTIIPSSVKKVLHL